MAFCNKLSGLLRRSFSQSTAPAMLNSLHRMYSTQVYVAGLPYSTDEQQLREAFSGFGDIIEARVINDRETGRSRGFGFVGFADSEAASTAISAMDGQEFGGRTVRVSLANDRPVLRPPGGGDRGLGGNGGYGY